MLFNKNFKKITSKVLLGFSLLTSGIAVTKAEADILSDDVKVNVARVLETTNNLNQKDIRFDSSAGSFLYPGDKGYDKAEKIGMGKNGESLFLEGSEGYESSIPYTPEGFKTKTPNGIKTGVAGGVYLPADKGAKNALPSEFRTQIYQTHYLGKNNRYMENLSKIDPSMGEKLDEFGLKNPLSLDKNTAKDVLKSLPKVADPKENISAVLGGSKKIAEVVEKPVSIGLKEVKKIMPTKPKGLG